MTELGGYAGKILRINLTKREAKTVDLDKSLASQFLGGRGFNSKLLYDAVGPDTDPLGPENMLMFATGPLVGTMLSSRGMTRSSSKGGATTLSMSS
jgi:aldehyde:ferredoxin oxidoreductase